MNTPYPARLVHPATNVKTLREQAANTTVYRREAKEMLRRGHSMELALALARLFQFNQELPGARDHLISEGVR